MKIFANDMLEKLSPMGNDQKAGKFFVLKIIGGSKLSVRRLFFWDGF